MPSQANVRDRCDVDVVHLDAVRRARATLPGHAAVDDAASLLALLANATRLKILLALHAQRTTPSLELCVCDLAVVCGASKSLTSHQLRLLRTAGLIVARRAGKLVYYQLSEGPAAALVQQSLGAAMDAPAKNARRRLGH